MGSPAELEVFPKPAGVEIIVLDTDEVTSLCPFTGQPMGNRSNEYAPENLY